jgi:hypothetical protein
MRDSARDEASTSSSEKSFALSAGLTSHETFKVLDLLDSNTPRAELSIGSSDSKFNMSNPSQEKADKAVQDAKKTAISYAFDWGSTRPFHIYLPTSSSHISPTNKP